MTREQAIDLQNNPNWVILRNEVDKMIGAETEKLLSCKTEDCIRLQERVRALRFCTRLPQFIADRETDMEPEPEAKIIT